jgi:ligand-binding SRPBCC domain-containing protein
MKFTCSITINKPRETVVEYFINPDYLKECQKEFIRKELISGEAQQNGAISKMYYKLGKGEMVLTETILSNDLPNSFYANYHHKHTDNTMRSTFKSIDENTTQFNSEVEYTAFRGIIIKVMARLFPGFFKKQVQRWLENLKTFAEAN